MCLRYGNATSVDERHRHRYEVSLIELSGSYIKSCMPLLFCITMKVLFFQVNPDMVPDFERAGLQFVGKDESGTRMEVDLEFFLGYCRYISSW